MSQENVQNSTIGNCLNAILIDSVKCKLISLVKKITITNQKTASYCYAQPVLVFFPTWIRIMIPSFVCGFVVVNLGELIAILMDYRHRFIEIMLSGIGCIFSFVCGIFELWQWTTWFVNVMNDNNILGWQELFLGLSCLCNGVILLIDLIRYLRLDTSHTATPVLGN